MSADIASLYIKVDSSGVVTASKDLEKLAGHSKQAERATTSATDSMKASWISVAAATAAVMALIKQSVQVFMEQEKATLKMGMAMKNQGDYSRAALKDMQDYAAQLQKVTAYEDDATMSLMANMKSYGMTNAEVKKATKVAMDFAAAKQAEGMTVSTAAELLGKAYAGNTMMLGRYGIIIDDSIKKGEKFDAVLKLLNQRFGGSAQAELLTYAGQWAKLKNQWSDIQEFLGLVFLKTLQALQVAAGLVAVAFLSMGSKVLGILNFLMTPLFKLLDGVGWVADKLGATGISNIMEGITTSIDNARQSVLASKNDVMAWTSANYDSLKSFDGMENALDKMGKTGSRTTYKIKEELTEAEKAAIKLREEWDATARALKGDQRLAGLEGIRKEFETNLIAAEEMKVKFKDLPPNIRAVAYALIEETKAQKDAGVITLAVQKSREDYAEAVKKERAELEQLINAFDQLASSLDPAIAIQNQYQQSVDILTASWEAGIIKKAEYDRLMGITTAQKDVAIAGNEAGYYAEIAGYEETYRLKQLDWIEKVRVAEIAAGRDKEAASAKAAHSIIALEQEINDSISQHYDMEHKYQKDSIKNAINIFENASELMDKESKEYKLMQDFKKAAQIAELAMEVEKNVQIVAGYFARSTAAVASAAVQNVANTSTAITGAVSSVAAQGTVPIAGFGMVAAMLAVMAGVLGMAGIAFGGGSSSGGSSTANLPKSTVLGAEAGTGSESVSNSFELLKDIYDIENTKLTNIYNELRDLNNNITGLVTSIVRTGGVSASSMGLSNSTTMGDFEKSARMYIAQDMGFLSKIGNFLNQPIVDIGNFIFGGKVKTKVTGSGIAFDDQSIADILSGGMDASQYADIKKTKSGWLGSSKTSRSTKYGALDEDVSAMFDKVFQGMGQSLVYFAENLGTGVSDVLNYTFEQTKLNLKDMTAEEMSTAISEYISSASDNAVSALFGDIVGKYQQLNEGLMETATRLIIDKEIVTSVLDDTGKAFSGTVPQMIAFSEQLIDIAGGLQELTDAAQQYIDKFYTDAEKFASTKESIRDVAGILPRTREDYRKLVESIDLTSEVGKQAYYTLMALSDTADGYYSHLEEIASQRYDMEIELMEAQGKTAEALAASRKRELEAMDESLRPLQELIWLTQDLGTELQTVTTSVTTEINALISNSSSAASAARSMANTYKNLIETMEEAQIKIFGGGKVGAQTRLSDIYKTAMTGDADALGKMPAAIDTLLAESLASSRTELEYRRDKATSYIALENAQKVSQAMVNWNEYHATLLETQVKVLEEMREDIANNNLVELQKHSELLQNISTLLSEQTVQVVAGNTFVQDQTGKIVAGNLLTQDQTGKIISQTSTIDTGNELVNKQTAQVITGNAVQDVIKNIDALNTSYTAEMLAALVNGGAGQSNSLLSILSSSQTVVTLLGQLVAAFEANEQAVAAKEIEMSKAEYLSAVSDREAALAAYNSAITATSAANEKMNIEGSQYLEAQRVASTAAQIYTNQPTAANLAIMQSYLSAADAEYAQFSAAQANYNTVKAQEDAALRIYNEASATVTNLKAVTNALIDIYNARYPSTPIQKFAEGGYVMVGENGPELAQFGSSARIYSNKDSKALMDNSELIAEFKSLRKDFVRFMSDIKNNTKKSADVLQKYDEQVLEVSA